MIIVQFNAYKNKDNIRTFIEDWKETANMILNQESKIFSIREETFISEENRLYILYKPEIRETTDIRVITLVIRKKNMRAHMRPDLLCNGDIVVMDIQEKEKDKK